MTSLTLPEAHRDAELSPGVILFTVSVIADGATTMARVYSSHPDVYPVGGRKTIDGHKIDLIVAPATEPQTRLFLGAPEWALVYADSPDLDDLSSDFNHQCNNLVFLRRSRCHTFLRCFWQAALSRLLVACFCCLDYSLDRSPSFFQARWLLLTSSSTHRRDSGRC